MSGKPAMSAFFTRSGANEGIKLPLVTPTGEATEHWVTVRGVDSDAFRLAEAERRRDAVRVASIEDPAERDAAILETRLLLVASLVAGWSFEEECTPANVLSFLREAPQIADAIDTAATRRASFFARRSSASASSPGTSSSST